MDQCWPYGPFPDLLRLSRKALIDYEIGNRLWITKKQLISNSREKVPNVQAFSENRSHSNVLYSLFMHTNYEMSHISNTCTQILKVGITHLPKTFDILNHSLMFRMHQKLQRHFEIFFSWN